MSIWTSDLSGIGEHHSVPVPSILMISYLFYDIETTGLNKAFDQILQFSAIRTEPSLKEIDRYNITIRLRPDIIPSPSAMITHRIGISELLKGMPEYEAIVQIHRIMNTPGTVSLGYNTLGFDDAFLRFSFHRNLLPPYTHQYGNKCGRKDLLPVTIVYFLYKNEALNWPALNGKTTLKLEHLSTANQLADGKAHTAETDVIATLSLCRRLSEYPDIWQYLSGYFNKLTDADRISKLPVSLHSAAGPHTIGLLIGSEFGPDLQYQAPVLSIGSSIPYSNQTLWLRLDLPGLKETVLETIETNTWVIRKRFGDVPIILPPQARYWERLDSDRKKTVAENLSWIGVHTELFLAIVQYHQNYRYPEIPDLDPDAALYQMGFLSRAEEHLCRQFHAAELKDKARIVFQFPREETQQLAARILFRNYPHAAPVSFQKVYNRYMQRVTAQTSEQALVDYKGQKRTTPIDASLEIERLCREGNLDPHQLSLLSDLKSYIKQAFVLN